MPSVKAATEKEKREIRRNHRKLLFVYILLILSVPFVGLLDTLFKLDLITVPFALFYIGFLGWLFISYNLSKCPRCNKLYFYSSWWPINVNKCSNCGLSIKETKSKK